MKTPIAMPNILIVEDDALYTLQIEALLDKMGYESIASVDTYEKALDYLATHHVDIILMDIILPKSKKTGIELADKIKSRLIPILFMTSQEDETFYKQASSIPLSSYLVKPFHAHSLDSNIRTLLSCTQNNHFLRLNSHTGGLIKVDDIVYLEVDNNYTYVNTTSKKTVYKKSLSTIMELLPTHLFLQVHRRFVVQKRYIASIDFEKKIVILENKIELPISRRMGQEIKKHLNNI